MSRMADVAADESWWAGAGSGVVGVPHRVHAGSLPNYPEDYR